MDICYLLVQDYALLKSPADQSSELPRAEPKEDRFRSPKLVDTLMEKVYYPQTSQTITSLILRSAQSLSSRDQTKQMEQIAIERTIDPCLTEVLSRFVYLLLDYGKYLEERSTSNV